MKFLLSIIISAGVLWSVCGYYLGWRERADAASSLPSLKAAGSAIKQWETDHGTLPNADAWVRVAEQYKIFPINDPVYFRICGAPQKSHPGWGMNNALQYYRGQIEYDPKTPMSSKLLPQDAILLLPSFSIIAQPLRNGVMTEQRLSETDATPTTHQTRLGSVGRLEGRGGMYFNNANGIEILTPAQAMNRLSIRKVSDSEQAKLIENAEREKKKIEWNVKNNSIEIQGGFMRMISATTSTPLIPLQGAQASTFSFEAKGDSPTSIETAVKFFDQYRREINVAHNAQSTTLVGHYGGSGTIHVLEPLPNGPVGFNRDGAIAESPTELNGAVEDKDGWTQKIGNIIPQYKSGTRVVCLSDFSIKKRWDIGTDWQIVSFAIPSASAPIGTSFFSIEIRHVFTIGLNIQNIKVGSGDG